MRLGTILRNGSPRAAIARPGGAVDVALLAAKAPDETGRAIAADPTVEGILEAGPKAVAWLGEHEKAVEAGSPAWVRSPAWEAPLRHPQKICCIGLNYLDHCREQGLDPPTSPVLFAKFPSAIIGPGQPIRWDPALSAKIDWEAELAIVVGKRARNVPRDRARDFVAGYMVANDVTARDIQKGDGQWIRGKSLDTFCPVGPHLVTADEVADPHNLGIQCRVNGVTKQDSNTKNLIFGVDELVAFLSRAFTLLPGDVILTGTPPGVGMHRKPPEFLKAGDTVEAEIEGLGILSNPCLGPA